MRINELYEQRNAHLKEATTIRDLVKAEDRELTDEELQQVDAAMDSYDEIGKQIEAAKEQEQKNAKRLERLAEIEKTSKQLQSPLAKYRSISNVHPAVEDDPNRGFKSVGEFLQCVIRGSVRGGTPDRRLFWAHGEGDPRIGAALSTYGAEKTGQDGGYAVPPQFSDTIQSYTFGEESFLPYCDVIEVEGNSFTYPRDITTPWGSAGVQVYTVGEATAITQSKPSLEYGTLRLVKFACLVPLTDELIADARALESWVPKKTGEALMYKINDKIINGTGANEPLGVKNSGALVTQAKETSQTADTITDGNVAAMVGRLVPGSLSKAVWLIAPDAWNQLPQMTVGDMPVFLPPGMSLMGNIPFTYGSLFGRPILPSMTCQTLGDAGDIYLIDFSKYIVITKAGATIEQTSSIHLWFDQDVTAFRAILRMNGQPAFDETVTADNGSSTFSPYITLIARA